MALAVIPGTSEDSIYAGTRIGLFRYSSTASAWQPVAGLMDQMSGSVVISALATDTQQRIYAAISNVGVFRSTDGDSWQNQTTNLLEDPIFVSGLAVTEKSTLGVWLHGPDRFFAVNFDSLYSSDTIFDPSCNIDWERRITGQFGSLAVDPFHPQIIYAGAVTATVGVALTPTYPSLISLDNGTTWQDAGNLGHPVNALAADPARPGVLYAATDGGVYVGEVTLPILWREIGVWTLLYTPLILLAALLAYAYLALVRPYGVPLPAAPCVAAPWSWPLPLPSPACNS